MEEFPARKKRLSAPAVKPPSAKRPPTPNTEEPPTMAVPGSVPDEHNLSDVEVTSEPGSEEGETPARSSDQNAKKMLTKSWLLAEGDELSEGDEEDDEQEPGKPRRRRSVFADADKMKQKVREAVMKKEYDVRTFYKDSGLWASMAKSIIFDHITLLVIFFNAFWIAIEMDLNTAKFIFDAHPVFQIVELFFCIYFSTEVIIRFMAFKEKRNCLRDSWFVFDTCLVMSMIVDTVILNIVIWLKGGSGSTSAAVNPTIVRLFRLLKLTRMARMIRLLRAMPELMILIKGIAVAFRSVIFTLCLLLIFIYLFAILFKSLLEDHEVGKELFPSIPTAMLNLLTQGTLPDHEAMIMKVWNVNAGYGLLAFVFILMTSLTVMNMLVGVLVEVVGVVSTVEKEQMNVQFVYSKLQECLITSGLDADGDMRISKAEFESLLLNPKAARMVQEVGVDVVGLVDFSEYLFQKDTTLSFPEFMDLVLQLRGSNTATVKDVVDLRKFISVQMMEQTESINKAVHFLSAGEDRGSRPRSSHGRAEPEQQKLSFAQRVAGQQAAVAATGPSQQWASPRPGSANGGSAFLSPWDLWLSGSNKHGKGHFLDEEV